VYLYIVHTSKIEVKLSWPTRKHPRSLKFLIRTDVGHSRSKVDLPHLPGVEGWLTTRITLSIKGDLILDPLIDQRVQLGQDQEVHNVLVQFNCNCRPLVALRHIIIIIIRHIGKLEIRLNLIYLFV
jgi:hypothetical protein